MFDDVPHGANQPHHLMWLCFFSMALYIHLQPTPTKKKKKMSTHTRLTVIYINTLSSVCVEEEESACHESRHFISFGFGDAEKRKKENKKKTNWPVGRHDDVKTTGY